MLSKKCPDHPKADGPDRHYHIPTYGARLLRRAGTQVRVARARDAGRRRLPICHDELNLDGNPALNLASFVTTWMEPEAERLIVDR